jgi:phosphoribosylformimino-5-aminoimidazole carboxamide ribotide isomerase
MLLYPAIDIKDGKCVRLYKGHFHEATVYGADPAEMAQRWADLGAQWLHLVDLDASTGATPNLSALEGIRKKVNIKLQIGGGLKSLAAMEEKIHLGMDRLILGTLVCENPELVREAADKYPGRLAAALDASGRILRTWGWQRDGGLDLLQTAGGLKAMGLSLVIHTDVDRDGTQSGPNIELASMVAAQSGLPTLVSGGISGPEDLRVLKTLSPPGVIGAISGKALYEGSLDYLEGQAILG